MARLFIAIDLPEDRVAALKRLRDDSLEVRWTPPEQYHLTLRFIGETEESKAAELTEALTRIESESFGLSGQGLDVFPSRRRPRVLVVSIERAPTLMLLQEQVDRTVVEAGLTEERKPFNPHITIARNRDAVPREVRTFMQRHREFAIEPFQVESFHLYQSDLRSTGAVHTVRSTFDLDASA